MAPPSYRLGGRVWEFALLQSNTLAYYCFVGAGTRHETPGSETRSPQLRAQQALMMMLVVVLLSLHPWGDWEGDTTPTVGWFR